MRQYTDKQVIEKVESLPTFKGWKKGIYDVWVRSEADQYDAFDDKAFTFEVESNDATPKFIMKREGTTNTGSYGLKNFEDYNASGAAVLKSNVIVYDSHVYGNHPYRGGKPAYRQSKAWPYFRDNNKNNKAEEIGKELSGVIGANIHRAGVNSTVIKNWSTACLVTANLAKFQAWLDFMIKKGKPSLHVAILKEWNPTTIKPKKVELVDTTAEDVTVETPIVTTPPVVESAMTTETKTEESVNGDTTTTETVVSSNPTVEVKQQDASLWAKVVAVFGTITAAGFNLANVIETKINEMTLAQVGYMALFIVIAVGGWYLWNKSKNRAHQENLKLIEVAADTKKNNVVLV